VLTRVEIRARRAQMCLFRQETCGEAEDRAGEKSMFAGRRVYKAHLLPVNLGRRKCTLATEVDLGRGVRVTLFRTPVQPIRGFAARGSRVDLAALLLP